MTGLPNGTRVLRPLAEGVRPAADPRTGGTRQGECARGRPRPRLVVPQLVAPESGRGTGWGTGAGDATGGVTGPPPTHPYAGSGMKERRQGRGSIRVRVPGPG